ncbi:MAG TPA: glycosyltransferase family 9 protein, partial [Blastocatellia bacterium]|nr:glycosyltransferase family 9 protein [Blastocatellia bacterium]
MTSHPHSILVINAVGFWRSLAMLPAMRALRSAYPRTFITAAATKGTCEILSGAGLADETID